MLDASASGKVSDRPDPAEASTPAELIARLNQLRTWAGRPSFRVLRDLAGARPGTGGPPAEALPTSTTHEILAGRRLPRLPRLDFVEAFVAACLRARQTTPVEIEAELDRWRDAWRALAADDTALPQKEKEPAVPQTAAPITRISDATGAKPARWAKWRRVLAIAVAFAVGAGAGSAATMLAGPFDDPRPCLRPTNPDAGKELVVDGGFVQTRTLGYSDSRVDVDRDNSQLLIKVEGGSRHSWQAVLEQRLITLTEGRLYTLSFEMYAEEPVKIHVTTQLQFEPFTKVIDGDVVVNNTHNRYSLTGVGGVTTELGMVSFHLGGYPQNLTFRLDNVSLMEYTCT